MNLKTHILINPPGCNRSYYSTRVFPWINTKHLFILCILGCLFLTNAALSQTLSKDVQNLIQTLPSNPEYSVKNEAASASLDLAHSSEIKMLFLVAIRGYQLFVSSQDISACTFVPSCSRFSRAAFQQAGFVKGLLLTSDRLQRCNGLPGMARHYHFLPEFERFSDPVENYIAVKTQDNRDL